MPLIESDQSGVLNTTSATNAITISAVVLAQSYVIVTLRSDGAGRTEQQIKAWLSTTTNLQVDFESAPSGGGSTIEWRVIEFTSSSGIAVQSGVDAAPGGTTNVTISAVTVADSHLQVSGHEGGSDDEYDAGKTVTGLITTTTNIEFRNGLASNAWQVVDWNGHANVETIDLGITASDTGTVDTTIGTLTDYTKTAIVANSRSDGAAIDLAPDDVFEVFCTSNTNVRSIRQGGTGAKKYKAQVIEFTDSDIEVQQFRSTIASTNTSTTATLTSVDTSKASIWPGSSLDYAASSDNTSNLGVDTSDYMMVSYDLTNATTVTMERTGSGSFNSQMSFSVVEFDVSTGLEILPSGIASGEAFGNPSLTVGSVDVAPSGIASGESFGSATLSPGAVDVAPSGIPSGEAFGPLALIQDQFITTTGIASGETFGSATLSPGAVDVAPSGIASGEAFGSASLTVGGVALSPDGIASGEAFGSPSLTVGSVDVAPSGIASGETFGSSVLTQSGVALSPDGIASGEAFGSATLSPGAVDVAPNGIASGETFGSSVLTQGGVALSPDGIASGEAFGSPSLTVGSVDVAPSGIASGETFGAALIGLGTKFISPDGIASGEAFGSVTFTPELVNVSPLSIASSEAFGSHTISQIITLETIFNQNVEILAKLNACCPIVERIDKTTKQTRALSA